MRFLCFLVAAVSTISLAEKGPRGGYLDQVAGKGYGSAGCGLGSVLFGTKSGGTQIVAASSNLLLANQSFGISFGTLNCFDEGDTRRNAENFIHANREALETESARGDGDSVTGLASVLGCPDFQTVGMHLHSHFREIFPSATVSSSRVSEKLLETLRDNTLLEKACHPLG